jgi:hypothetical protein
VPSLRGRQWLQGGCLSGVAGGFSAKSEVVFGNTGAHPLLRLSATCTACPGLSPSFRMLVHAHLPRQPTP